MLVYLYSVMFKLDRRVNFAIHRVAKIKSDDEDENKSQIAFISLIYNT